MAPDKKSEIKPIVVVYHPYLLHSFFFKRPPKSPPRSPIKASPPNPDAKAALLLVPVFGILDTVNDPHEVGRKVL